MIILKWFSKVLFLLFYVALIGFSIYGLLVNGVNQIKPVVFYFVLLGLLLFPLFLKLIPSLESFNILGVELKFQKDLEETKRHLNDLQNIGDEKMKQYIFQFVNEESLTEEGKNKLKEWKEAADVPR
jgi:hypothetical protein